MPKQLNTHIKLNLSQIPIVTIPVFLVYAKASLTERVRPTFINTESE